MSLIRTINVCLATIQHKCAIKSLQSHKVLLISFIYGIIMDFLKWERHIAKERGENSLRSDVVFRLSGLKTLEWKEQGTRTEDGGWKIKKRRQTREGNDSWPFGGRDKWNAISYIYTLPYNGILIPKRLYVHMNVSIALSVIKHYSILFF